MGVKALWPSRVGFSTFQLYFLLHTPAASSGLGALPGACHLASCRAFAHPLFSLWIGFPFSLPIETLPESSAGFNCSHPRLHVTTLALLRVSVSFPLRSEVHVLISFLPGWFILWRGSTSFLFHSSTHQALFCY